MKNALHPRHMTPRERRAALCKLLALGLLRLRLGGRDQRSAETGEGSLHNPPDRSGHATPTQEETNA